MFGSTSPQIGNTSPSTSHQPPQRGRWRRRLGLIGTLAVGASMAVVGVTSTGAFAANVAQGKVATASSTYTAQTPASDAVDGSTAGVAAGGAGSKWVSAVGAGTKWLQVDLGREKDVTQFVVKHAGAGGESASLNTKAFNIQTSLNGANWTTWVTVSNNTASVSTHSISGAAARYVKLNITQAEQSSNNAARIYELEVNAVMTPDSYRVPTAASSPNAPCNSNENAGKAVDGRASTKWCTTAAGVKTIDIQLDTLYEVTTIRVKHAGAVGESTSFNTRAFKIYAIDNSLFGGLGGTTTEVANYTNNTANITHLNLDFVLANKIRIEITQAEQSNNNAARIPEIEVYGPEATPGVWDS